MKYITVCKCMNSEIESGIGANGVRNSVWARGEMLAWGVHAPAHNTRPQFGVHNVSCAAHTHSRRCGHSHFTHVRTWHSLVFIHYMYNLIYNCIRTFYAYMFILHASIRTSTSTEILPRLQLFRLCVSRFREVCSQISEMLDEHPSSSQENETVESLIQSLLVYSNLYFLFFYVVSLFLFECATIALCTSL